MVTSILPGPGTFHLLCHPLVGLACVHADTTPGILGNEWPRKLRSTLKLSLLQIESYLLEIFVITAVCFRGKCSKKRIKQRSFFSLSAKFQRILSRANPFTCLVCPGFTYCAHFHSKHDFAQQCAVFKYFGDRSPPNPSLPITGGIFAKQRRVCTGFRLRFASPAWNLFFAFKFATV